MIINMNIIVIYICFIHSLITEIKCVSENSTNKNFRGDFGLSNVMAHIFKISDAALQNSTNELCELHLQMYSQGMTHATPWALKMLDSSTRFPESIMEQQYMNFGNFYECVGVDVKEESFRGKYCLVYIHQKQNYRNNSSFLGEIKGLLPNGTIIQVFWAMCIPSSCSAGDWQMILNNVLESENIPFSAGVAEEFCTTDDKEPLTAGDWSAIGVILFFTIVVILSTTYDIIHKNSAFKSELFTAFSIYKNGKKLIATTSSEASLESIHGIRFLTMAWITLAHTVMSNVVQAASVNKKQLYEKWPDPERMYLTGATLSVDVFLFLTGVLLAYTVLKNMKKMNKITDFNIPLFYFHRYLRITIPLAIIALLQATILSRVGTGPLWKPNVVENMSRTCKQYWWSLLLYIQNYYNPRDFCLDQAWYVAVDMQLYILSPFVLIPLWKKPKVGKLILGFLFLLSIVINFVVAYQYKLTPSYITATHNSYEDFVTQYFYPTHTRYGPFIVGIVLGYILTRSSIKKQRLSKAIIAAGWICGPALSLASMYIANIMYQPTYKYNIWECSFYIALYRNAFTIGIAWIVFACVSGYGGLVNTILAWKGWQPLSRLSYCIYLVQISVIYMRTFSQKTVIYIDDVTFFSDFFGNLALCILASIPLTLMFEAPTINLLKLLTTKGKANNKQTAIPVNGSEQPNGETS